MSRNIGTIENVFIIKTHLFLDMAKLFVIFRICFYVVVGDSETFCYFFILFFDLFTIINVMNGSDLFCLKFAR